MVGLFASIPGPAQRLEHTWRIGQLALTGSRSLLKRASLPRVDSIHAHPFGETKGGSAATIVSDRARHSSIDREQPPAEPRQRRHCGPRRWCTALKMMERRT